MHSAMDYITIVLLVGVIVVILVGLHGESKEQADLRREIELLNERMDRAGFPDRLPVHVITDAGPAPDADVVQDPDGTATTVLPVVGRHRIERRTAPVPPIPEPREVTTDAPVVVVRD